MLVTKNQLRAELEAVRKDMLEVQTRFDELYTHLKIHRAYVPQSVTPSKHELRAGPNPVCSTISAWPNGLGGTTYRFIGTVAPEPKKKKARK